MKYLLSLAFHVTHCCIAVAFTPSTFSKSYPHRLYSFRQDHTRTNFVVVHTAKRCLLGTHRRQCSLQSKDNNYDERNNYIDDEEDEEDNYNLGTVRSKIPTSTFGADVVPTSQQPANEYLNLITSPLFSWANEENGDVGLAVRLGMVYLFFFTIVCYPISGATFTQEGFLLHKVVASNVGAIGVILLTLVRLYTGWGYIGSRLTSKVIEYEETGWYDGKFEEKTESEKARDIFLYRQNVQPVEERLKKFTLAVGAVWVACCLTLNGVMQAKPLFDEYDPDLLERLVYDEKLANVAAKQSAGRPTYCDNRYYRAVANGGQGCN